MTEVLNEASQQEDAFYGMDNDPSTPPTDDGDEPSTQSLLAKVYQDDNNGGASCITDERTLPNKKTHNVLASNPLPQKRVRTKNIEDTLKTPIRTRRSDIDIETSTSKSIEQRSPVFNRNDNVPRDVGRNDVSAKRIDSITEKGTNNTISPKARPYPSKSPKSVSFNLDDDVNAKGTSESNNVVQHLDKLTDVGKTKYGKPKETQCEHAENNNMDIEADGTDDTNKDTDLLPQNEYRQITDTLEADSSDTSKETSRKRNREQEEEEIYQDGQKDTTSAKRRKESSEAANQQTANTTEKRKDNTKDTDMEETTIQTNTDNNDKDNRTNSDDQSKQTTSIEEPAVNKDVKIPNKRGRKKKVIGDARSAKRIIQPREKKKKIENEVEDEMNITEKTSNIRSTNENEVDESTKKQTKSVRSGLVLPVGRIEKKLRSIIPSRYRVGSATCVALAAVSEYLASLLIYKCADEAEKCNKRVIKPSHMKQAILKNNDLNTLYNGPSVVNSAERPYSVDPLVISNWSWMFQYMKPAEHNPSKKH